MAGMSVDGLVSGLDTAGIIKSLLQVEGMQQAALRTRVSSNDKVLTALRTLTTKSSLVGSAADALAKDATWQAIKATTTGASVTAAATQGAAAGTYDVTVHALATGSSWVSAGTTADPAATTTFATAGYPIEVRDADGVTRGVVSPSTGSLGDVVKAINDASATLGVKAIAVQTRPGEYRLQVVSTTTGAASAFSLHAADGSALMGGADAVQSRTGGDARIDVGGLELRRPTNSFADAVPGLTLTATQTGTSTVAVAQDPASVADAVQKLVDAANAVLGEVATATRWNETTKSGGPLVGRSAVRQLAGSMTDAVRTLDGSSLAAYGIELSREGTYAFDRAVFLEAYAADPAAVRAAIAPPRAEGAPEGAPAGGFAGRLARADDAATTSGTGALATLITGVESSSKVLTTQIEAWDRRLELRRIGLQRQFSGLEVALQKMQSQSQWLAGQLASLPTSS